MPRFLHIADPHIDSPIRSLQRLDGAGEHAADTLTRDAFAAAIDLAIEEKVDLVVIAGDLFDGDWKHAGTWQWTRGQFERLIEHGIPAALVRGNHDAASELQTALPWPDGVHEFRDDGAHTIAFEEAGFAVHGHSYARRETTENLAKNYPAAVKGLFNIGLLHTAFEGESAHANYAPASPDDLLARGYGYWALGHVHKPTAMTDASKYGVPILFAGNPQGRDVGEAGPRGVVLVDVANGEAKPTFRPLDRLRWFVETVSAEECETKDDLVRLAGRRLEDVRAASAGRDAAVRLQIGGPFAAHAEVDRLSGQAVLEHEIREAAEAIKGVRIESVRVSTSPMIDLDAIRREGGILADVLAEFDRAIAAATGEEPPAPGGALFDVNESADEALLGEMMDEIEKATLPLAGKEMQPKFEAEDRVRWLQNARSHLIAQLQ